MPNDHPNVLLICTDHWPGSQLGCAGHPAIKTPTLDQLAVNGTYFPNTYSECPVSVPARRTLMTGLKPHSHGMLSNDHRPMPQVPTMAQSFRDAGYQAFAVGKLHVTPQRDRIGFDEVILDEEGRGREGVMWDDYEIFLADHGQAGERFGSGMNNNAYVWRPWHLDERLHVTNWAAQQMCRQIIRRDPRKPGFFYLSFCHPHPPLQPLRDYLDMYRDVDVPQPFIGDWAQGDDLPAAIHNELRRMNDHHVETTPENVADIRRAHYALCTHIDHQIRRVIGTLREQDMLGNTIICFTADHGDMLGNHGLWTKHWFYEDSARVPMIVAGTAQQSKDGTVGHHRVDDRLVGWADVMPTLLSLAGIDPPTHCEGKSMFSDDRYDHLYGVWGAATGPEGAPATRMIRDQRYKLIYYPAGNLTQLFDMIDDPNELHDLGDDAAHADTVARLKAILVDQLRDGERDWLRDGALVGYPDAPKRGPQPNRHYNGQRGLHSPPPAPGKVGW